jgi:hypothetical protein
MIAGPQLPRTIMAPFLSDLTATLGFCCPAAFFAANRRVRSGVLADRLGVDERTVQRHRARWRAGEGCQTAANCLIATGPENLQSRLKRRIG